MAAPASGGGAAFLVTLHSLRNYQFQLDFYNNSECDPSGHGEGREHLFSLSDELTQTDVTGDLSFRLDLDPQEALLTATDALGNTSEFSPCAGAVIVAVSTDPPFRAAPGEIIRYTVAGRLTRTRHTRTRTAACRINWSLGTVRRFTAATTSTG